MKAFLLSIIIVFFLSTAIAQPKPSSVGDFGIGMSAADFRQHAAHTVEVQCSTKSENSTLSPILSCDDEIEEGVLIRTDTIIGELAISTLSIKLGAELGERGNFIFHRDRLVDLTIYSPNVESSVLEQKYGRANIVDKRKRSICQNRLGGKFDENTGSIVWSWKSANVTAELERNIVPLSKLFNKCGVGSIDVWTYRIFEPRFHGLIKAAQKQMAIGETARKSKSSSF